MGLIEALVSGPVALDTVIFIYFIEEHPFYLPLVEPVFQAIDTGQIPATTSTLTLLETLVVPYRNGDIRLAERYEAILTSSRGLVLVELTKPIMQTAARLRANTNIRTPDAPYRWPQPSIVVARPS
jgi:predicted nucleic acid-binding protein